MNAIKNKQLEVIIPILFYIQANLHEILDLKTVSLKQRVLKEFRKQKKFPLIYSACFTFQ